jgi:hypothetical protein
MGQIGNKMKNFINWFKKDTQNSLINEPDDQGFEDCQNSQGNSSHRSADLDEQVSIHNDECGLSEFQDKMSIMTPYNN